MREEWKMQENGEWQNAPAVKKSRTQRTLFYWGREILVWVACCITAALVMGGLQMLGINTYVQGDGMAYLAFFPIYLLIMGTFVLLIFGIAMFQSIFPVLISVNVTRKGAVCGIVLSQGIAAALILLISAGAWMLIPEAGGDKAVSGLLPLFTGVLFGGITFGILFGVVIVRWGKIGVIIMVLVFAVIGGFGGAVFAMLGSNSLMHMQKFLLESVVGKNFLPIAVAGICAYVLAGIFAIFATRKTEIKV